MFESDAAAAEALASAAQADAGSVETPSFEQAPAADQTQNAVEAGTNQSSESFTAIDINSLPEEVRTYAEQLHRQLQGDYTRKTQEAAPWRKIGQDFGISPDEAQQALGFVQSLRDPEVQRELYTRLSEQFDGSADAEQLPFGADESGYVDPRDRQLQELQTRLERFEQQQAYAAADAELARAETVIRQSNPDFQDADMERIQRIALSMGGDIMAATESYKGWQQEMLSSYLQRKGTPTPGGMSLPGTGHAETPTSFESLDDPNMKAAIASLLANQ